MSPSSCVHISRKVSCVHFHLSHLFLLVVHRLSILRAARRRSLPKAAQAQTPTFFLLFVQNLVLKTEKRRCFARGCICNKPDCYSGVDGEVTSHPPVMMSAFLPGSLKNGSTGLFWPTRMA